MRKTVFTLALFGLLVTASCTKTVKVNTTETIEDGKTVTTITTETDYDMRVRKAEDDYNVAEGEVRAARDRGDTKAERIAQDAADKAKSAWEATKSELQEAGAKTKEAIRKTGKRIEDRLDGKDRDTIIIRENKK